MALALGFPNLVLFTWKDIWVEEIDNWLDIMAEHPFNDGAGTWRTASMKENAAQPFRNFYGALLLHLMLVT